MSDDSKPRRPAGDPSLVADEDAPAEFATLQSQRTVLTRGAPTAPTSEQEPSAPASSPGFSLGRAPGEGDVIAGRFQLMRQLGSGGMGRVFEARHLELQIPVAVKLLHRFLASDSESVERFHREALAASWLQHPNVVRVLDFGAHADTFYIVMDLVRGISLSEWTEQRGGLPLLTEVQTLVGQILEVLALAHEQGIVHRDIKPENVIVTEDDQGRLSARLTDFGLVRLHHPRLPDQTPTRDDLVAGTPAYMSPEQCRSLRVGPATDLYAVGCLLTELLQLKPPYVGDTAMDVIAQQMFVPIPPLARPVDAEPVPESLEQLRRALLAKQPHQRPASAELALVWLNEALSAEPAGRRPSQRVGALTRPRSERAPPRPGSSGSMPSPATRSLEVALLRIGNASGIDTHCIVGCAVHDVTLHVCESTTAPLALEGLVLLDAGGDVAGALAALTQIRAAAAPSGVLVCLQAPSAADLRDLIEAGAAEFARYPLSPELIVRKLRRVHTKYRRQYRDG